MSRSIVPAAVALCAVLAAGASASAAPVTVSDGDTAVRTVRYTDAELRTPDGAVRLALRLRIAAAEVCGGDSPLVRSGMAFRPCQRDALGRALATLNAPMVDAALSDWARPTVLAHR